jgi:hypothetical protein
MEKEEVKEGTRRGEVEEGGGGGGDIYNALLQFGIFPYRLRTAIVTPIYKKGDKEISKTIYQLYVTGRLILRN